MDTETNTAYLRSYYTKPCPAQFWYFNLFLIPKALTETVIGCAIEVHRILGSRLLINFNESRLANGIKRYMR